jgi:hypothetical protein
LRSKDLRTKYIAAVFQRSNMADNYQKKIFWQSKEELLLLQGVK